MPSADSIANTRFALPHPDLRRYVTAYYISDIQSLDGNEVEDLIHPEWGSVRYLCKGSVRGGVIPEPLVDMPPVILTGPTSRASPLACISARIASFGLLPLGWHRFVGLPANRFADHSTDGFEVKAKTDFAGLHSALGEAEDLDEVAALFDQLLLTQLAKSVPRNDSEEARIEAAHMALVDPDIATVADMAEHVQLTPMQLERLSKQVFGFPPKLLIRRQRFLRTLGVVLQQPQSRWSEVLDPQYYDQAHFNRDFRRFFGMAPKEYLAMPRPVVKAAAMARIAMLGDPLQGLQRPRAVS